MSSSQPWCFIEKLATVCMYVILRIIALTIIILIRTYSAKIVKRIYITNFWNVSPIWYAYTLSCMFYARLLDSRCVFGPVVVQNRNIGEQWLKINKRFLLVAAQTTHVGIDRVYICINYSSTRFHYPSQCFHCSWRKLIDSWKSIRKLGYNGVYEHFDSEIACYIDK